MHQFITHFDIHIGNANVHMRNIDVHKCYYIVHTSYLEENLWRIKLFSLQNDMVLPESNRIELGNIEWYHSVVNIQSYGTRRSVYLSLKLYLGLYVLMQISASKGSVFI